MKTTSEVFYKVVGLRGKAINGGRGRWPLPHDGQPGKWVEVAGPLVACLNGLHVCRLNQLLAWLGPTIWRVEINGERIEEVEKIVARRGRLLSRCEGWTEKSARLFAVACARRALEQEQEAGRKPDARSWEALTVATAYAHGRADAKQLLAAGAAARAAARDAARATATAWATAWAAGDAAWDDARATARAAGNDAWDAAWAGARAAAGATAGAAWDAAWAAAWAARDAGDARDARDATWGVERQWQMTELKKLVEKTSDLVG